MKYKTFTFTPDKFQEPNIDDIMSEYPEYKIINIFLLENNDNGEEYRVFIEKID